SRDAPDLSRRPPRAAAAATAADGPPSASRRADARRGRRAAVMDRPPDGRRRPKSAAHQKGGVNAAPAAEDAGAARGKTRKTGCARVPGVAQGGGGERRGYAEREREQQQEEQEGVAAAAQQGPRRRLAAAAQKMMSSSFFVLSSALGTSRADTGAGIARPLASSSFLSAIFSRSIFAFFFSTTFLTLKNSSRSISSISCVMYWMVSSMRGIRTYCRAFTRRLVILISSSRVLKAHCNEASLIRATIDLK
ncbi:unnamed protein product, partial [Prorocentrum cordatum]